MTAIWWPYFPNPPLAKCPYFTNASAKLDQLKSLGSCLKCSQINHKTENRKFTFKCGCFHCQGWHMSYLCKRPKDSPGQPKGKFQESNAAKCKADRETHTKPKSGESKSPVNENSCNNVGTLTDAVQSTIESESILLTFQCFIKGRKLRGLKDSACQSNFIVEKLASQLDLKVIRNSIAFTVNGINVPKFYKTKLVEAEVLIGKKIVKLQDYCLPSIGISLNLAKLGNIANEFVNEGYSLADPDLISSDCITNIEFILGVQSSYCLLETEVVFGKSSNSLYSKTHMGVILKG